MQTTEFINAFKTLHKPEQAQPMEAYMRQQFPFIGVKASERKQFERPYFKEWKKELRKQEMPHLNWMALDRLWQEEAREFQYVVCDFVKTCENFLQPSDLQVLLHFITTKAWWDTVDSLAKPIGHLVHTYPELLPEVDLWMTSQNLWLKRLSIIHQLSFKENTDTDLLTRAIEANLGSKEFFINKAIGWALREYAKTDPDWVKAFIKEKQAQLNPLSLREASKYLQ